LAILKIARMGHPVLSEPARPVSDPTAAEIHALVQDMEETMRDAPGIGLAAPQVHVPLRIVIFDVPRGRGEAAQGGTPSPIPSPTPSPTPSPIQVPPGLNVLINPIIEPLGEDMEEDWEGCLSVPGMTGRVPRWSRIRYTGVGLDGRAIEREAEGFHARVVQHECDHLDGVLYPMRIEDMSTFGFVEEIRKSHGDDAGEED